MANAVAFACLALILAGGFGRFDARFDAINFALPYLLAAGLAAGLVGWRIGRTRAGRAWLRAPLLVGALLAAAAPLLAGEWRGGPAAACGGPVLRLVQYNAYKANAAPAAAARWLALSRPDIIVLEEGRQLAPLLAPLYPWRQSCARDGGCSTIILSRIRPRAAGGAARGDPENRGALSAAWMRFPAPAGDFTVIGVHLGRPWPFHRFLGERPQLAALVAAQGGGATIVAGDFNLPGWTFQMRRLAASLGLARRTLGVPSWPARLGGRRWPWPLLGIDHVLVGPEWRAGRIVRGPSLGSDHRPVTIELERCDQRAGETL